MAKSKKKRQDNEIDELQTSEDVEVSDEEPTEEEEEREEGESDVFAEDESDIAMMRKLEDEDTRKALSAVMFDEEVGFNPMFDWESVSDAEKSRFETLKAMDIEGLEAYAWKRLNAFQKWMFASVCSQRGLHALFREIVLNLIHVKKRSPELCIEDIYPELIWDYLETKEYDEALKWVDEFEEKFVDEKRAAIRVRGLIQIAKGDVSQGKSTIDQLHSLPFNADIKGFESDRSFRDADRLSGKLQFEVGSSLINMGIYPVALQFFERAKNLAQLNHDHELLMAIDNAKAVIAQKQAEAEDQF